jgi:hypothetical protein
MPSWFLYTLAVFVVILPRNDGFALLPLPQVQRVITSICVAARNKPVTEAQQEQLDMYGPTPETSMEILLEQLMGDSDETSTNNSNEGDDFFTRTGADEIAKEKWQTFLSNLQQMQTENKGCDNGETNKPLSPKDVSMMFFREGAKS